MRTISPSISSPVKPAFYLSGSIAQNVTPPLLSGKSQMNQKRRLHRLHRLLIEVANHFADPASTRSLNHLDHHFGWLQQAILRRWRDGNTNQRNPVQIACDGQESNCRGGQCDIRLNYQCRPWFSKLARWGHCDDIAPLQTQPSVQDTCSIHSQNAVPSGFSANTSIWARYCFTNSGSRVSGTQRVTGLRPRARSASRCRRTREADSCPGWSVEDGVDRELMPQLLHVTGRTYSDYPTRLVANST